MLGGKHLVLAAATFLAACNGSDYDPLDGRDESPAPETGVSGGSEVEPVATARILPKSGSSVSGEATLTQQDGSVAMVVRISNAPPGAHAIHLHENGDCSAPDAGTAGSHWNPTGQPHGKRDSGAFHAGDVGNIDVGPDGIGSLTVTIKEWSLGSGSATDPLGRAVVIHAQADDFTTQPDGGGGQKIGCGVIEMGRNKT